MNRFLIFTFAIFAAPVFAQAATVSVQPSQGKVEFHAVGRPSMIKVNGEGAGPHGTLEITGNKVTGDLMFDLASLTTGIPMRDTHMKEKYLEVPKYPEAKLHLTDVTLPASWSPANPTLSDANFKADLTLHGVTKPIDGKFDITGSESAMGVKATFTVMIDQFGITIPTYLGVTVKNDVPVELNLHDLKANAKSEAKPEAKPAAKPTKKK